MPKYSIINTDPDKSAKAYGYELHCSPKDSMNLAYVLKGMKIEKAKEYLEDIIKKKRAVPTTFHKGKRAHRRGMGPGSYPQKAAKYMLRVLKNAENNAEYKGFDAENMKITHISTYQGRTTKGTMPRAHGRATDKNRMTTNIELVIEEAE